MTKKQPKTDEALDALYAVLREDDWPKVLALGQAQLATSTDKLAVLEAMLDAIENLLHEGELADPAPFKALEKSLRAEKKRLVEAGAKSDVYSRFLDPPQEDD